MKQITKLLFETEKKKNILESKVSAAKKALAKAQAALTDSKGGKAKSTRSRLQAQTKGLKSKKKSERKNSVTVSKKKFDNEEEEDEWQDAEDDENEDEREVWDDDDDDDDENNEEVEKEIEGKQSVEQEDGRSDGGGWDTVDDNVGTGASSSVHMFNVNDRLQTVRNLACTIIACNSDGTYDIQYVKGGDEDYNVSKNMLRVPGSIRYQYYYTILL